MTRHAGFLTAAAAAAIAAGVALPATAQTPTAAYDRMIVFGDSISDSGTYADKAPAGAGRFTTNPDPVWVEQIARALGLPLTSAAAGGLNFAEGGARVSEPRPGAPGDLSRRPITEQIEDFLSGDAFRPGDLVIIQGGGNDVFHTQTNGLDFTPADLVVLETAAEDLAAAVGRLDDAGAEWLLTTSVPEFEVFNAYYRQALAEAGTNALYFDAARFIDELKAEPSVYGLVNIVDPACRGSAVQSFRCLPEDLVAPDANRTYLMADRVHFTGGVHEMKAEAALSLLGAVHQADAAIRLIDASRPADAGWLDPEGGERRFIGAVEGRRIEAGGAGADIAGLRLGAAGRLGGADVGLGIRVEDAEGGAGGGADLGWTSVAVTAVAARDLGPVRLRIEGGAGRLEDVTLARRIDVGPATRVETGRTSGGTAALALTVSRSIGSQAFHLEPWASLEWTRTRLEGWQEEGSRSTAAAFDTLDHERTEAGLGLRASFGNLAGDWTPHAGFSVHTRLAGDEARTVLTPAGAPISFAAPRPGDDDTRSRLELGVSRSLGRSGRISLEGVWTPTGPWDETGVRLQASHAF